MTLRQLPGALILGLLASLVAHMLGYSDGHAQAGAYHGALIALATAGGLGLLAIATIAAFTGAGPAAQGSVIAARISSHVPSLPAIGLAALLWFGASESLEPTHATISVLLIATLLAIATAVIGFLASALVRVIATLVLALHAAPFANREPIFTRRAYVFATAPQRRVARQPVSRPPPAVMSR